MSRTQADGLNVIALVSGGKDSFFSLLHCRANGHRVVALANLHPALSPAHGPFSDGTCQPPDATAISDVSAASAAGSEPPQGPDQDVFPGARLPDHAGGARGNEADPDADEDERDLNSFMYQTVGHQAIPLYAEATGIPLYRRAIAGAAAQHGKEYSHYGRSTAGAGAGPGAEDPDETESMVPLLQAIKAAHPDANAICAGAILSTYQRTRVESVATRLGLAPLAYLWKFPVLPGPAVVGSDAQLLDDMAAVGLEARIIKVASGGLDDSFLWTDVASAGGKARLARAMRRFGTAETGAVIGEGGEFETLVLDGPPGLFRKRIVVAEEDQRVVTEGGGSAWLSLRNARLEDKGEGVGEGSDGGVRIPDLLDTKFVGVLDALSSAEVDDARRPLGLPSSADGDGKECPQLGALQAVSSERLQQWSFVNPGSAPIEAETQSIVDQVRQKLQQHALSPSAILSATIILRHMADFPAVNSIYGTLFDAPNPPSRVTIACGDALSAATDASIAVYLTVHTALPPGQRHGLHVQSRSYWAPANIGPYSQAISIPVASLGPPSDTDSISAEGPRLVTIAGQIPLIPATMTLPPPASTPNETTNNLPLQLTLSLQHLWRIALETGVQWLTGAVAFFPRSPDDTPRLSKTNTRLAIRAWKTAHHTNPDDDDDDDEDEDEDDGPDLWDRRFNPLYSTLAGSSGGAPVAALPDRSVLSSLVSRAAAVPPLFVAEVEALPRAAAVEWQGLGLGGVAGAREGGVVVLRRGGGGGGKGVAVSQVVVAAAVGDGDAVGDADADGRRRMGFVQTVVAERLGGGGGGFEGRGGLGLEHGQVARAALARLGEVGVGGEPTVMVRYVDAEVLQAAGERGGRVGPVVPCWSLWDDEGERLAAVTVYQSVFEKELSGGD
ncbi:adenine nucleotide alpha hydrolases-like protein [Trichocladium antarcticum]|uniref:Diphthine--ammonia ligase n=1 Tax=Trichocladium antarcticum TaxID=1450529 RepID=A0AAN6ZB79_9PEZI|nr:adenine nucleotide alpha hydrolases-like protein [Trichocladium antarcticum]